MARRVVLGLQNSGQMGLRCSSAGHDAYTAADDGHAITFDSTWTDLAKVYIAGLISWSSASFLNIPGAPVASSGFITSYPSLGYKPFAEIRRLSGTTVYDDYWDSTFTSGSYASVYADHLTVVEQTSTGDKALFILYQIPVASQ